MSNAANIRAMLDSVVEELVQIEARADVLRQRRSTLEAWLSEEGPTQETTEITENNGFTPLSGFLRRMLSDGKSHATQDLGAEAQERGLIERNKSPGRAVHFALVNLERHGYVTRDRSKNWVMKME